MAKPEKKEFVILCPYGCGNQINPGVDALVNHLQICPNNPEEGRAWDPGEKKSVDPKPLPKEKGLKL